MNNLNLNQQYQKLLVELGRLKTHQNETEEISWKFYSSEWITMYLLGNMNEKTISIQVEMTYSGTPEIETTTKKDHLKQALLNQISTLEYLRELSDNGFTLGFLVKETIWFATMRLNSEPNKELCDLIHPPQSQV